MSSLCQTRKHFFFFKQCFQTGISVCFVNLQSQVVLLHDTIQMEVDALRAAELTSQRGRPSLLIAESHLQFYLQHNFKVQDIAVMFGCSKRTIERRIAVMFGCSKRTIEWSNVWVFKENHRVEDSSNVWVFKENHRVEDSRNVWVFKENHRVEDSRNVWVFKENHRVEDSRNVWVFKENHRVEDSRNVWVFKENHRAEDENHRAEDVSLWTYCSRNVYYLKRVPILELQWLLLSYSDPFYFKP